MLLSRKQLMMLDEVFDDLAFYSSRRLSERENKFWDEVKEEIKRDATRHAQDTGADRSEGESTTSLSAEKDGTSARTEEPSGGDRAVQTPDVGAHEAHHGTTLRSAARESDRFLARWLAKRIMIYCIVRPNTQLSSAFTSEGELAGIIEEAIKEWRR